MEEELLAKLSAAVVANKGMVAAKSLLGNLKAARGVG